MSVEEVYETPGPEHPEDPLVAPGSAAADRDAGIDVATVAAGDAYARFAAPDAAALAAFQSGDLRRDFDRAAGLIAALRERAAIVAASATGKRTLAGPSVAPEQVDSLAAQLDAFLSNPQWGFVFSEASSPLPTPSLASPSPPPSTPTPPATLTSSRIASLTARISALEATLGDPGQGTPAVPLLRLVADLEQRQLLLRDLDVQRLTRAHRAYAEEMKTQPIAESGAVERSASRCLEAMGRWDEVAQAVPAIVDRLRSLHHIHVARESCREQAEEMLAYQQAIQEQLRVQQELLTTVQATLAGSVQTMQNMLQPLSPSDPSPPPS